MNYEKKYLKYKIKYLQLKDLKGRGEGGEGGPLSVYDYVLILQEDIDRLQKDIDQINKDIKINNHTAELYVSDTTYQGMLFKASPENVILYKGKVTELENNKIVVEKSLADKKEQLKKATIERDTYTEKSKGFFSSSKAKAQKEEEKANEESKLRIAARKEAALDYAKYSE